MARIKRLSVLVGLSLTLAGCISIPSRPSSQGQAASWKQPTIELDKETGEYSMQLSVLTYNVAALPWHHRKSELNAIQEELATMQRMGTAPDVVLLQEAFTSRSYDIGPEAGYPYDARGPCAKDKAEKLPKSAYSTFLKKRSLFKGERFGKMVGSGLAVFSRYPIVERISQPFRRGECAGYDCLANKGMLMVRVGIPGLPVPVDILTTHLNSRSASGVPHERSLLAHHLQVNELEGFIEKHHDANDLLIFGGDFNIRRSQARVEYLRAKLMYPFARPYCAQTSTCLATGAIWWDKQDQQGFFESPQVQIRPVSEAEIFDKPVGGRVLSDHNGYLVVYRISWHVIKT